MSSSPGLHPRSASRGSFYKDWAKWGGGLTNYLSYGEFPTKGYGQPDSFKYPRGVVLNRDLSQVHPVNAADSQEIRSTSPAPGTATRTETRPASIPGRRDEDQLHRSQAAL